MRTVIQRSPSSRVGTIATCSRMVGSRTFCWSAVAACGTIRRCGWPPATGRTAPLGKGGPVDSRGRRGCARGCSRTRRRRRGGRRGCREAWSSPRRWVPRAPPRRPGLESAQQLSERWSQQELRIPKLDRPKVYEPGVRPDSNSLHLWPPKGACGALRVLRAVSGRRIKAKWR